MPDAMKPTDVTPETKIGPLLDAYPALENVLLDMSPHFAKLKNPVLRKTVAKIATLRQVAEIGNIPLATLINTLREAVGITAAFGATTPESAPLQRAPSWVSSGTCVDTYDARTDLEAGNHPAQRVMADLSRLGVNETYVLITPFVPAPLIELAQGKGFAAWSHHEKPDMVKTYFSRG